MEHTETTHEHKPKTSLSVPAAIIIAGLIVAVAIFAAKMPFSKSGGSETLKDPELLAQVSGILADPVAVDPKAVTDEDFSRGEKNAPLTFIVYSDTECPFCKRFHVVMNMIMADNPKKVRWIYRHFPLDALHKQAREEALATECAAAQGGNDAFWKYADEVFKRTKSNDGLDLAELPKIAQATGLNVDTFNTCMADKALAANVQADVEDGASIGVSGTPYTLVIAQDGKKYAIEGYRSYSVINEIIRQLTEK
jgi:protein-disulfide isomerase